MAHTHASKNCPKTGAENRASDVLKKETRDGVLDCGTYYICIYCRSTKCSNANIASGIEKKKEDLQKISVEKHVLANGILLNNVADLEDPPFRG